MERTAPVRSSSHAILSFAFDRPALWVGRRYRVLSAYGSREAHG